MIVTRVLRARWMARWFGDEVVEPVRLHVEAKRYSCAVDPSYAARLSEASQLSLKLQGGPMTADEVEEFQRLPIMRPPWLFVGWDDEAKDPAAVVDGIDAYLHFVEEALRSRPLILGGGDDRSGLAS